MKIARAAKVDQTALHYNFSSKQELYAAALDRVVSGLQIRPQSLWPV